MGRSRPRARMGVSWTRAVLRTDVGQGGGAGPAGGCYSSAAATGPPPQGWTAEAAVGAAEAEAAGPGE